MSERVLLKRRGVSRFDSVVGGFRIHRPSGTTVSRDGFEIDAPGHDYEILTEGDQVWLVDDEREVGYAVGKLDNWRVLLGERAFDIVQPKPGVSHSAVHEGDDLAVQFAAGGLSLRKVLQRGEPNLTDEQLVFLAAIVLVGWRETDRDLLGNSAKDPNDRGGSIDGPGGGSGD